ncbi:hypothetical protein TNCV_2940391 [Trichonephila clavipes]|nr:hypothetical protein TNCV_2940391 [Trichonephila clavipes]
MLAQITEITHFSKTRCKRILTEDLNIHRVPQHVVLQLLTTEQKKQRMTISGDLIYKADDVPGFFNHITTCEET